MKYQNLLKNGKIQCAICPRNCVLSEGQEGFCHVRKNVNGNLILTTYGYNTGLAIDPIEKKPLYQFYPSELLAAVWAVSFAKTGTPQKAERTVQN